LPSDRLALGCSLARLSLGRDFARLALTRFALG
jgi:hypothetical protein